MKILYAEDSKTLRETVARGLRQSGYTVVTSADGNEALNALLEQEFDVVILDIMLPGPDGFAILEQLRREGNEAEILLLSARTGIEDRVKGLDLGADDYLVKPFAFEELEARIRLLMRRRFASKSNEVILGKLCIDISAQRIFWDGEELTVRPREFDILCYLALRSGKIVSRNELIEHVYDHAADLKSNAVDSAICNIRKKLAEAGVDGFISTIPRRGYMLEAPK